MNHKIEFIDANSDWNEALPMGNGVMGAMTYMKNNQLTVAMNHYEVYYTILEQYSKSLIQLEKAGNLPAHTGPSFEDYLKKAEASIRDYTQEPYLNYQRIIWPETALAPTAKENNGASHPMVGEFQYSFSPLMENPSGYALSLDIGRATTEMKLEKGEKKVSMESVVLHHQSAHVAEWTQSEENLVAKLLVTYPQRRNQKDFTYHFKQSGPSTFYYTVTFFPTNEDREQCKPFQFTTVILLQNAVGTIKVLDNQMEIVLEQSEQKFSVITAVVSEETAEDTASEAIRLANQIAENLADHRSIHKTYWNAFFLKSQITIPDKILEKLWYYYLYILDSCSGKGGKRFEQASGLSGLWDIKQPTIWGSMWYWDVNIQSSYWPVYTANRLDLAEVFNDGFLSHVPFAEKRAKEFYHMDGYAIDYPHHFYNSIGPWCAQHLWWYYEYTLDKTFLREKAYPVFKKQAVFIEQFAKEDPDTGTLMFFPDVSPEQGPLTKNSVITIATVKYLLESAIKANKALDNNAEDEKLFTRLLEKMPAYETCSIDNYGEVLKDSLLSPPVLGLRHPSLLMPIFPVGEISAHSDPHMKTVAENTLRFAEDHTELGVFGFGWLSAAAARLGKGSTALRLLYEKGLDLILRANGMGAEETDRWMNFCCAYKPPYYYPFMMECIGETINGVNELLLQSFNGIINVFPAVPRGEKEEKRQAYQLISEQKDYPAWENCSFDDFLAKGGFEVSAKLENNIISYIKIKSNAGGVARVYLPEEFRAFELTENGNTTEEYLVEDGILRFDTTKNETYLITKKDQTNVLENKVLENKILQQNFVYGSHFGRRVFIGKTKETEYIKTLDDFLCDYYIANDRHKVRTTYRFNFGVPRTETTKKIIGEHSVIGALEHSMEPAFIKITSKSKYNRYYGYGFSSTETLQEIDRAKKDMLRRDFIKGTAPTSFDIELPKGGYEILITCGDAMAASYTEFTIGADNVKRICDLKKDEFSATRAFVSVVDDGILSVGIRTKAKREWNLSTILIKKINAYM